MKKSFSTKRIQHIALLLLRGAGRYSSYINLFALFLILLWLYFFVEQYYIGTNQDVIFMKRNIPNMSYLDFNKGKVEEAHAHFQEKTRYKLEIPKNLQSPF